jgi:hypothetical protein
LLEGQAPPSGSPLSRLLDVVHVRPLKLKHRPAGAPPSDTHRERREIERETACSNSNTVLQGRVRVHGGKRGNKDLGPGEHFHRLHSNTTSSEEAAAAAAESASVASPHCVLFAVDAARVSAHERPGTAQETETTALKVAAAEMAAERAKLADLQVAHISLAPTHTLTLTSHAHLITTLLRLLPSRLVRRERIGFTFTLFPSCTRALRLGANNSNRGSASGGGADSSPVDLLPLSSRLREALPAPSSLGKEPDARRF